MREQMGLYEWILLILLSIIWGSSFIFIELALESFSPFSLVFFRVFIGAIALTLLLAISKVYMPLSPKAWWLFFVMSFFQNTLPFCLISWGQLHITAGLASIFNGTTPIFSVILAYFFVKDSKITAGKIMGVIVGVLGVIQLVGFSALTDFKLENWGQLAVLGAAVCYAISLVFGTRLSDFQAGVAPAGMLWCSSISMLPILFFTQTPIINETALVPIASVFILGVVCSAIAYILFFKILKNAGAINTSLVTFLIPVSALLLAWLFLNESIKYDDIPGILLIFLGLVLVDGRFLKMNK